MISVPAILGKNILYVQVKLEMPQCMKILVWGDLS